MPESIVQVTDTSIVLDKPFLMQLAIGLAILLLVVIGASFYRKRHRKPFIRSATFTVRK